MTEAKKRPRTPAQAAAEKKYAATHRKTITITLNRTTDADIVQRLEYAEQCGNSIPQYIRSCIRYAMSSECIDTRPPRDE